MIEPADSLLQLRNYVYECIALSGKITVAPWHPNNRCVNWAVPANWYFDIHEWFSEFIIQNISRSLFLDERGSRCFSEFTHTVTWPFLPESSEIYSPKYTGTCLFPCSIKFIHQEQHSLSDSGMQASSFRPSISFHSRKTV
jgi:hypothetical protein